METIRKIKLLPICVAVFLFIAAAVVTTIKDDNPTPLVFPNITEQIKNLAVINIDSAKEKTSLIKNRLNDEWFVGELGGYPAESEKVNDFIEQVSSLRIIDIVSINPVDYPRFGLGSTDETVQVSFITSTGEIPVSFTIGDIYKDNYSFIREVESREVLKVSSKLPTDNVSSLYWVNNKLFDINAKDITSLHFTDITTSPKEEIVFTRENNDSFKVTTNIDDLKLSKEEVNKTVSALEALSFIDVKQMQDMNKPLETVFKIDIYLHNGDVMVINFVKVGDTEIWLEVLSPNTELNRKYQGWLYKFPWEQILDIVPASMEGTEDNV